MGEYGRVVTPKAVEELANVEDSAGRAGPALTVDLEYPWQLAGTIRAAAGGDVDLAPRWEERQAQAGVNVLRLVLGAVKPEPVSVDFEGSRHIAGALRAMALGGLYLCDVSPTGNGGAVYLPVETPAWAADVLAAASA